MAAVPPTAGLGAPSVPPVPAAAHASSAPLLTFTDRYRDVQFDSEADEYGRLLLHFDPMSPQSFTANQLLESVLQESDDNSRAIIVHWQNPNDATQPGRVVVPHGIKRYPRSPGGVGTPWDNKTFAWFQDVVASLPPTLFELPQYNIFSGRRWELQLTKFMMPRLLLGSMRPTQRWS
jgi:hypothetical protein